MPEVNNESHSKLRWSKGGLVPVINCPACKSGKRTGSPINCHEHRLPLPGDNWQVHRCANCSSLYLDPKPDNESLSKAYEVYYTHDKAEESVPTKGLAGFFWRLINGYLNNRFGMSRTPEIHWGRYIFGLIPHWKMKLDFYGRHLYAHKFPKRGRLLDIGCGNGAFLARAMEMGWDVVGLEPDPQAVAVCRKQGIPVIEGSLSDISNGQDMCFDVITMNHSIEHMPFPNIEIKKAYQHLRPNGILWLAYPNPNSLGAYLLGNSWYGLHPPYHLVIPSLKQLKIILRENGFTEIETLRRGEHARYIMRKSSENLQNSLTTTKKVLTFLAPLIQIMADLAATISSNGGEELIVIAKRPIEY